MNHENIAPESLDRSFDELEMSGALETLQDQGWQIDYETNPKADSEEVRLSMARNANKRYEHIDFLLRLRQQRPRLEELPEGWSVDTESYSSQIDRFTHTESHELEVAYQGAEDASFHEMLDRVVQVYRPKRRLRGMLALVVGRPGN